MLSHKLRLWTFLPASVRESNQTLPSIMISKQNHLRHLFSSSSCKPPGVPPRLLHTQAATSSSWRFFFFLCLIPIGWFAILLHYKKKAKKSNKIKQQAGRARASMARHLSSKEDVITIASRDRYISICLQWISSSVYTSTVPHLQAADTLLQTAVECGLPAAAAESGNSIDLFRGGNRVCVPRNCLL